MALNKGNYACSSGLSKKILDALTGASPYNGDLNAVRIGFSNPLSAEQLDMVKGQAWALAQAVADQYNEDYAPVFCWAQQTVTQSIPNSTVRRIDFNSVNAQTTHTGSFTGSGGTDTWLWTCPAPGRYNINAYCTLFGTASGESYIDLYVNGTIYNRGSVLNPVGSAGVTAIGKLVTLTGVTLAQGDTVYSTMFQSSGAARNTSNFYPDGYFMAVRVS
jgi:hypothetical protein